MDYKNKLKKRLYLAYGYIIFGLFLIIISFVTQTENYFISTYGFALAILGLARIRNYRLITKNAETIHKQQIIETDERNIVIIEKSRSLAFAMYFIICGVACIILSFLGMHSLAQIFSYSIFALIILYALSLMYFRKKY